MGRRGPREPGRHTGPPKTALPLEKAHRLLNTGATVLVSSAHRSKRSVLAVAWQMPASIDPMLVVVSIGHARYSHGIIARAKEFVINVPTVDLSLIHI